MPSFADLKDHPLVAQCLMWCLHMDIEPLRNPNRSFLLLAIHEYDGNFSTLTEQARRFIAGAAEDAC